jgi:hypothetical protein
MNTGPANPAPMVFSYLQLRKIIGLLGVTLPFLLAVGALVIFRTGLQDSISSYYHTGMQDVFVGILCVIGFFLLSYKGYERSDDIGGDLACLFAVGVALFPTSPGGEVTNTEKLIGSLHLVFAALFFLTLIWFSLFQFTKSDSQRSPTRRKLQRNQVYRACGHTMALCIALIAVYHVLPGSVVTRVETVNPVFWLEALAILAFGISWLTKGEAILKDEVLAV